MARITDGLERKEVSERNRCLAKGPHLHTVATSSQLSLNLASSAAICLCAASIEAASAEATRAEATAKRPMLCCVLLVVSSV